MIRRTARGPALVLGLAVILFFHISHLFGQGTGRGTIAGTVTDQTNAVVPGAQVTVTNSQTGLSRTVVTNDSGTFVVSPLPAGQYNVAVESTGFKRKIATGIVLEAEERLGVNMILELGDVTETVTVTGAAPVLQTETGEVSSLVSQKQAAEIPINGRNWSQFVALGTGVSATNPNSRGLGQEGNPGLSVHGNRVDKVRYAIDGIQNIDNGGQAGVNNFPPPESIAEIKVLKSNFRAESGSYGAAVANVVTKSGTQDFHGTIYEFFRNDAMDSRNFFASEVAPLKLNHFGFNIGGPVSFGGYNRSKTKSFFFYSQSFYERRGPALGVPPTITARTPPQELRAGDFSTESTQLKDPSTGGVFPNNMIPVSRVDSNATILLDEFFPLPNRAGQPNWVAQPSQPTSSDQELIRWDQNFTDSTRLMVRFIRDGWTQEQDRALWSSMSFDSVTTGYNKPGKNFLAALTTVINPTLVNEFAFGTTSNEVNLSLVEGGQKPADLMIPELFPENEGNKIPDIILSQGWGGIGVGRAPYDTGEFILTFRDDLTKQVGNHSLRFGFETLRLPRWVTTNNTSEPQGQFSFNGGATGHAVADFLVGNAFSYTEAEAGGNLFRSFLSWQHDFYAQDDWKITPSLTLNYGLRYSIFAGGHVGGEIDGLFSLFQPAIYDPALAVRVNSDGSIVPGSGDLQNGLITPAHPRAGEFGGSDLYRTRYSNFAPRVGLAYSISRKTVIRTGVGIYYGPGNSNFRRSAGHQPPFFLRSQIFQTTLSDPGGGEQRVFPSNILTQEPDGRPVTSYQWSFGIQQEVARETLFEVTYVGNAGAYLDLRRNLNKPVPDPTRVGSVQAHRPFLGWSNVLYHETSGRSAYHGLEAHLSRRFHNGLLWEVSYTFSKALGHGDNTTEQPQDIRNVAAEWSYLSFDRPHIFVTNLYYELPYGRQQNTLAKKILGGWAFSGIVTIESGLAAPASLSGDPLRIGGGPLRPDQIGDPNDGPQTVDEWINTAAFARPAVGQFGNAARNPVRLPGLNHWTTSIVKNTSIGWFGQEPARLQIRGELFNAFNNANFNGVQLNFNSGIFGKVTSAHDPRIAQIGIKLMF